MSRLASLISGELLVNPGNSINSSEARVADVVLPRWWGKSLRFLVAIASYLSILRTRV